MNETLMKMSHFLSYPLAFRYLDIILMVKISQQHILSICRTISTIYYVIYIIYTVTWSVVSWMLNWTLRWTQSPTGRHVVENLFPVWAGPELSPPELSPFLDFLSLFLSVATTRPFDTAPSQIRYYLNISIYLNIQIYLNIYSLYHFGFRFFSFQFYLDIFA